MSTNMPSHASQFGSIVLVAVCAAGLALAAAPMPEPNGSSNPSTSQARQRDAGQRGDRRHAEPRVERPPLDEAPPPDQPPPGPGGPPPRPGARRPGPPALDDFPGNPFHPQPQDLRPLGPNEDLALLRFARERLPQIAEPLDRIQSRNPREFRRRLEEVAPRLRMLRRLLDDDPEVGQALIRHATNLDWLRRAPRMLDEFGRDPEDRAWVLDRVRHKIRENVEIETRVIRAQLVRIEQDGARLIERQLERMFAPDGDLKGQPPPVLDAVARYWSTDDADVRRGIEEEWRQRLVRRGEERARVVREHLERLEQDAQREIEQRFQRWLEPPDRREGPERSGPRREPPARGDSPTPGQGPPGPREGRAHPARP